MYSQSFSCTKRMHVNYSIYHMVVPRVLHFSSTAIPTSFNVLMKIQYMVIFLLGSTAGPVARSKRRHQDEGGVQFCSGVHVHLHVHVHVHC